MSKEYIEREALRQSIEPWLDGTVLVMPVSALDEAPAADVEPVVHGEWVYDRWCEFKCSICGHWSNTLPRAQENFCPNCGAKMDGGNKK